MSSAGGRPIAHVLSSELTALVCQSLRECESADAARQWLAERSFREKVAELAADNERSLAQLEATKKVVVAILNRPELIHFGLLADSDADTKSLLLRAVSSSLVSNHFPHSGIWKPYVAALIGFMTRSLIVFPSLKPKGYENYYIPYLEFMAATDDEGRNTARRAASDSFHRRNSDRRCIDWVGLDGDGKNPVRWDFRLFTLECVT